jgi:hypothetical protein
MLRSTLSLRHRRTSVPLRVPSSSLPYRREQRRQPCASAAFLSSVFDRALNTIKQKKRLGKVSAEHTDIGTRTIRVTPVGCTQTHVTCIANTNTTSRSTRSTYGIQVRLKCEKVIYMYHTDSRDEGMYSQATCVSTFKREDGYAVKRPVA